MVPDTPPPTLTDIDVVFDNGIQQSFTVDEERGDTLENLPDGRRHYKLKLADDVTEQHIIDPAKVPYMRFLTRPKPVEQAEWMKKATGAPQ